MKRIILATLLYAGAVVAAEVPDTTWTYKQIDGKELKMDVFLPEGYESGKNFPVFVVYHGGSWQAGEPSWHYPDCAYWSSRGMVAVSVAYRLKDRDNVVVPLECVKDAKSAIRFLRKNAVKLKLNPEHVVVAGDSAGGQMAAATAMIEEANDAGDDLSVSCVPNAVILHNPYFKCQADLSPPNFVKAGLPPFITFLGSQDPAIKVEELNEFHEALQAAGNASEYYVGPGGQHGFCNGRNKYNPFFYWSKELEDQFLVKHGILTGESLVRRPPGVEPVVAAAGMRAEAPAAKQSELFVRLDTDHSHFVSLGEYVNQFTWAAERRDADKNGLLTLEEFPFAGAFKTGDSDQDGMLNGEETRAMYQNQFQGLDKNQDGVLTPDEM
jgi:acetyl esterase